MLKILHFHYLTFGRDHRILIEIVLETITIHWYCGGGKITDWLSLVKSENLWLNGELYQWYVPLHMWLLCLEQTSFNYFLNWFQEPPSKVRSDISAFSIIIKYVLSGHYLLGIIVGIGDVEENIASIFCT